MVDVDNLKPTERFGNRAKYYSQARPDYPAALLDYIWQHCHLSPGSKIVDIGSGTGISSRALAERGTHVTGIEPNDAMLEEAMTNPNFRDKIEYIKASAESTGLPNDCFDAIFCAQAFHWFQPDIALQEFRRILKPGAWVVLIWNERDESDTFTKSYGDLLRTLPDTSQVEVQRGKAGNALLESSQFCNALRKTFAHQQILDLQKLIGRAFSASYSPTPETAEAVDFEQKLRELFNAFQQKQQVNLKYECSAYLAQKPEG